MQSGRAIALTLHLPCIEEPVNFDGDRPNIRRLDRRQTVMPYPFLKRWMRVSALTKNRSAKRCRCECVALNRLASRSRDWLASLAAGADRLVHRSVSDEQARAHHRRLVVAALFVPLADGGCSRPDPCRSDRRHGDRGAGLGTHRSRLARGDLARLIRQSADCRVRLAAACHAVERRGDRRSRPVVAAGAAGGVAAGRMRLGAARPRWPRSLDWSRRRPCCRCRPGSAPCWRLRRCWPVPGIGSCLPPISW